MIQKLLFSVCLSAAVTASWAGTPTIDGSFDGTGTWGSPVASNATGGWQGFSAPNLYVTSDATYVYVGAEVANLGGNWQSYGFAIHSVSGGGNTQEPWGRQINFNFTNAPDFAVRGNLDNSWHELRIWDGTDWDAGGGSTIGGPGGNAAASVTSGNGFVEARILRSVIGASTAEVTFFLTGNNNEHGLFDALPNTSDIADQWNETGTPNGLATSSGSLTVPVTISGLSVE